MAEFIIFDNSSSPLQINNRLFNTAQDPDDARIPVNYDESTAHKFSFNKLLVFIGPGFLMSIAYLDPGRSYQICFYRGLLL